MIIHVVKPGESIYSIAKKYKASPSVIITENELTNPSRLVIGQAIVITQTAQKHFVAPGQSLYAIAGIYGISVEKLLSANPQIKDSALIYPGTVINIPDKSNILGTIEVNGYTFPQINAEVLRKTLPYLTYLSIFSYEVNPDGSIRPINDDSLIQVARAANTAPFMVITNLQQGKGFSSDLARTILTDNTVQDKLLSNVIETLKAKKYYGLGIDFEYIYPQNREDYNNFLKKAVTILHKLGYKVTTALAPKISENQKGILYESHDYPVHGNLLDHVILMTYEWGYTYGPPLAVAPINEVRKVLDYAVTVIPPKKIFMGMPNYGYDWTLPYVQGTAANTISNTGAVERAANVGAIIQFDQKSQAPFYNYYDNLGRQHVVWFEDARSVRAKLMLVNEYGLGGISCWTIGRYFPQYWLVLKSMYKIMKVL